MRRALPDELDAELGAARDPDREVRHPSASSDALLYLAPSYACARCHLLWPRPGERQLGVTFGAGLGVSAARYLSTATGRGVRLEPSLELGLEVRL